MTNPEFDYQGERLLNASDSEKRSEYLTYCEHAIAAVEAGTLSIQNASYRICGMAARVLDQLSPADQEIMGIAGNLELPEAHQSKDGRDWKLLVERVRSAHKKDPAP